MTKDFPNVVAFCGGAAQGKTTAANIMVRYYPDFLVASFADPIRDMLRTLGLEGSDFSENKERPHPILCGKTPRYAMQTLGSEWARVLIGPDVWVNAAREHIKLGLTGGARCVFDDCRFENEAAMVRECGGVVVKIVRHGFDPIHTEHMSERGISESLVDYTIHASDETGLRSGVLRYFNSFLSY